MLSVDPVKRPDAEQALNHDWFHTASGYKIISDEGVLKRLGNFSVIFTSNLAHFNPFQTKCKLQQAIFTFIAIQTTKGYDETLMNTFKTLDTDQNGVLTRTELVNGKLHSKINSLTYQV